MRHPIVNIGACEFASRNSDPTPAAGRERQVVGNQTCRMEGMIRAIAGVEMASEQQPLSGAKQ